MLIRHFVQNTSHVIFQGGTKNLLVILYPTWNSNKLKLPYTSRTSMQHYGWSHLNPENIWPVQYRTGGHWEKSKRRFWLIIKEEPLPYNLIPKFLPSDKNWSTVKPAYNLVICHGTWANYKQGQTIKEVLKLI